MEEAGVAVNLSSVRYISSQPWPFPQSLMIGFTAEAINQGTRTGVSVSPLISESLHQV